MIEVQSVTKQFSGRVAVDNLSFTVQRGEILGFLGPNGAGKTTTMRMITTFLPPTKGKITVEGYDTVTESLAVRRLVGYMPETTPLYNEMRVVEYLRFRAKIKGVPGRERSHRIAEIIDRCGINDVAHKVIGYLSKGYRQRVSLAEAIIHNPQILILDEPTIGLDPYQVRQTRELIKELGRDRTIILSTHILPEVEMICNRVIIIHQGRIAAMDTLARLVRGEGEIEIILEAKGLGEEIQKVLQAMPEVKSVAAEIRDGVNRFSIVARADIREEISQKIAEHQWVLRELRLKQTTLEDLFIKVTAGE